MDNNNVQENETFQTEDESKTKKIIVKLDKKILMFVNNKRGKETLQEGYADLELENEDWLIGVYNKSKKLIAVILRDKKKEKDECFAKKIVGRFYACIKEFLENGERGCETLRGTNIGGRNLEFFYEFPARETLPFSKNFKLVESAIIEFGSLEQKNIFEEGIVLDRFDISVFKIIKKGNITEE